MRRANIGWFEMSAPSQPGLSPPVLVQLMQLSTWDKSSFIIHNSQFTYSHIHNSHIHNHSWIGLDCDLFTVAAVFGSWWTNKTRRALSQFILSSCFKSQISSCFKSETFKNRFWAQFLKRISQKTLKRHTITKCLDEMCRLWQRWGDCWWTCLPAFDLLWIWR